MSSRALDAATAEPSPAPLTPEQEAWGRRKCIEFNELHRRDPVEFERQAEQGKRSMARALIASEAKRQGKSPYQLAVGLDSQEKVDQFAKEMFQRSMRNEQLRRVTERRPSPCRQSPRRMIHTRPRERRATSRRATRAGPRSDDPDEPAPPSLRLTLSGTRVVA
jgi:hypothetical protein